MRKNARSLGEASTSSPRGNALRCLALALFCTLLPAVEDLSGLSAQVAAAKLGDGRWLVAPNLPAPILAIADASADHRQAFAVATGTWHARCLDPVGGTSFASDARPPLGPASIRLVATAFPGTPADEVLIRRMLAPWTPAGGGIACLWGQRRWSAALDEEGHRRMLALATALERGEAPIPPWSEPRLPQVTIPAHAVGSWSALAAWLAEATGCSVAIAPGQADPPAGWPLQLGAGEPIAMLAAAGVTAAWHADSLAIGLDATQVEREHPAQRVRLASIPLPRRLDRDGLDERLRRSAPGAPWGSYGWEVVVRDGHALVAADAATIHALITAVERLP